MPILRLSDINAAFSEGRYHQQRIYKTSTDTTNGQWKDWAYGSGQPGYDARVGTAWAFNPYIATKNDAIFFPDIPAGYERRLAGLEINAVASGTQQTLVTCEMYDLLGVYPLVDGDSTDRQDFDNSNTLPRYQDGYGVNIAIVNHVSPQLAAADGQIGYTDCGGVDRVTEFRVALGAPGRNVTATYKSGGAGGQGPIYSQLARGCRGVQKINWTQFATAPGGLYSIYLCKSFPGFQVYSPITTGSNYHAFSSKPMATMNCWHLPKILDGAHLGFWVMTQGVQSRSVNLFGTLTFIWG